jgi:outer membrane protein assembly factor BamB
MRALALFLVLGCAGGSATSSFGRAGDEADVATALYKRGTGGGIVNATGRPRVFLATSGTAGHHVLAVDLDGGNVAWRQTDEVAGRIAVARAAVVYARPDGALVGRDMGSGKVLWQRALSRARKRLGYAADADAVYDVTQEGNNAREVTLARIDARSGSQDWSVDLEGEAGAPAVRAGLVVLPRRSQYVTLIDAARGRVLADILSRDEAASFVRALPEGIFFGSRGIFLAAKETAVATRKPGLYFQAKLPAFIRPVYDRDMYRPEQIDYSAVDRNRLLWRAAVSGSRASFADDLVVAHTFRFFFGFDATSGRLRWAYSHPRTDAVASEHTGRSIVFVAADGELGAVDLGSGARLWQARATDEGVFTVRGATFDAEGFAPAGGGARESLPHTLANILWDNDKRFGDVKLYAITELARLEGKEVTAELLRALESEELPPQVVQKAVDALVERRDPASIELYTQALRNRSDYAEERRAPRLDVLARAVMVTKAKPAIPALVEHLRLPDTEPGAVRDIADAVLATGAREAVPAFQEFLVQYRADPGFANGPSPLTAAAEVLIKLGGASDRALLLFLADEPRTIDPLRAYLHRALLTEGGE